MAFLWGTTAGELCDKLELYMADTGINPSTKEQWADFWAWFTKQGSAVPLGELPKRLPTAEHLHEDLKRNGIKSEII